jgi:hypothetical protein
MRTHFLYTLCLSFLSFSPIQSQPADDFFIELETVSNKDIEKKEGLTLNLETNSLRGTFWVNYYVYSTDDCSNPAGMIGGTSSDRCEKISGGGSRSMNSCDSTSGVNVTITYDIFASDDCLGIITAIEFATYPAVCTNDVPKQGSYRGTCSVNPDYATKGNKDYVSTTCDGLVASYIGYATDACLSNGDGTYDLFHFDECSVATLSSHSVADCGDAGTNIRNYPIEAGTCHNDVNTDDLLYFDDDVNNGFHWNDKGSIKEYCNSAASIFNSNSLVAAYGASLIYILDMIF